MHWFNSANGFFLYIHGYGSNGNALKAQKLKAMFPEAHVFSPTFDYDRLAPQTIYHQLQQIVAEEKPNLILGSSMGGYYALCCSHFYSGIIWCVNPVRDILTTICRHLSSLTAGQEDNIAKRIKEYEDFDQHVFCQLKPRDGQLHFALSTDDELLGVIGHEMGHVALHHTRKQMQKQMLTSAALAGLASTGDKVAALTDSQFGALGEVILNAKFSRTVKKVKFSHVIQPGATVHFSLTKKTADEFAFDYRKGDVPCTSGVLCF